MGFRVLAGQGTEIVTETSGGRLIFGILAAVAEFEHDLPRSASGPALLRPAYGGDAANVFVHGYNNTFAEGLYRQAQLARDFALPATSVNFAWPSAAAWNGYPYDKESAIFATEGLSRTLDLVASSSADGVVVACHSMGCFLVIETMWMKALRGDDAFLERLRAVVMFAPDINVEVFRERSTTSGIRVSQSTSSPRAATRRFSCRPACTADKRGSA
jgi:esterase/lipase superfamily enzyme